MLKNIDRSCFTHAHYPYFYFLAKNRDEPMADKSQKEWEGGNDV